MMHPAPRRRAEPELPGRPSRGPGRPYVASEFALISLATTASGEGVAPLGSDTRSRRARSPRHFLTYLRPGPLAGINDFSLSKT